MSEKISLTLKISKKEIEDAVIKMAKEIEKDYKDEPLICICILKGAVLFFTDLVRNINNENLVIDFMRVSSYGNGTSSTYDLKIKKDIESDIQGKNVLIVEDIIDSGFTMSKLIEHFNTKGAKSVKVCALINKEERREVDVNIDYYGFKLESGFIVGYGLDYAEKYRQLPEIFEVAIEEC